MDIGREVHRHLYQWFRIHPEAGEVWEWRVRPEFFAGDMSASIEMGRPGIGRSTRWIVSGVQWAILSESETPQYIAQTVRRLIGELTEFIEEPIIVESP